jgi:hypothetical protein
MLRSRVPRLSLALKSPALFGTTHRRAPPVIARRALSTPAEEPLTWNRQDDWEDARGPLGIDSPSPKLAALTSQSPQWLRDLHRDGVSAPS